LRAGKLRNSTSLVPDGIGMPNPISADASRRLSWNEDSPDCDDVETNDRNGINAAAELSIGTIASGLDSAEFSIGTIASGLDSVPFSIGRIASGLGEEAANAMLQGAVLRPEPGRLQHLPPNITKMIQPAFDQLALSNGGDRLDVSTVSFVVKDLGGAAGHTVRDRVEISPEELKRPLEKQLYVVGHELAHVLQFEVIGPPGADADTRWHMMEERYASEARGVGRGSQYDAPPNLTFSGLNVVDRRYPLEAIATRVGNETSGRLFGP
jgi:hypothetical protein